MDDDDIFADVPLGSASKNPNGELEGLAAGFAKAKALQKEKEEEKRMLEQLRRHQLLQLERQQAQRRRRFQISQAFLAALLLWITYTQIIGIYLFTRGFLLTRKVLDSQSQCSVTPFAENDTAKIIDGIDGCWHPKTFEKAVIVIIDALRYDFTVPQEGSTYPYHNAFKLPHELARTKPQNAVLLPFIADPPTTTLQRLKGLTTGTLPTFIDAGSNFGGFEIEEDNLIAQLQRNGRKIAFMGDDTWTALFPNTFDIEHPYESLNVWDLHTVDNGVLEHMFPLLHPENSTKWDVLIGHFLGVDHAGHRYGPDHPAMTSKLQQMDTFIADLVEKVDDKTLVVIMGDHGMDPKGDHGGESQLELEAALWMYSQKPIFGRSGDKQPPRDATVRSVGQIDLVPTLALLLGIPIPYNNLGAPIEEAFIGPNGDNWKNLATVSRLTGAQIQRYQKEYAQVSNSDMEGQANKIRNSWEAGQTQWTKVSTRDSASSNVWQEAYQHFSEFQEETLDLCRSLWARFDLLSMAAGVAILLLSVAAIILYSRGIEGDPEEVTGVILLRCVASCTAGALAFWRISLLDLIEMNSTNLALFGSALGGLIGFFYTAITIRDKLVNVLPQSAFGWLSVVFTVSQAAMFAANSFTIWEDRILTFFLTTFALVSVVSSQRQEDVVDRALGSYHSIMFLFLTRLASLSRLCREEQMPYCESTYYSSATSSVSSPYSLGVLFVIALVFPQIIRSFYTKSMAYEGTSEQFIGIGLRIGLFLVALFWTLDSADNGEWFSIPMGLLKTSKMLVAQVVLSLGFVTGSLGFMWSKMSMNARYTDAPAKESDDDTTSQKVPSSSKQKKASTNGKPAVAGKEEKPPGKMVVIGYPNLYGGHYFLLVISWYLGLCLIQKPLGSASMGIMVYQLLSLLEIIDINKLSDSAIGPIICALLGASHYFSTGHQATLSSMQWEAAFIPLDSIKYPWSPLLITGNTLGPQILASLAVPATALWNQSPKQPGLFGKVARASATHVAYHTVIATGTVMWAGHLRRHLMLYRVFSPRFMLGATVLMITNFTTFFAFCGVVWMLTVGSYAVNIIFD